MVQAIRFEKTGGPEVLNWQQVEVGKPGPGQVRLKHTAVGLNYIDTYQRSGLYPMPLPSGLGSEAAGVIEEVGPGVTGLKPGDRVAYAGGPLGAYSEARVMPADRLVPVPDGITDQQAAAMMLKGMTAWYLIRRTHVVKPRRDDPDPCRGRRGRADRLPMGQASRRHRDRHGRQRREGRARQGAMAATTRSSTGARISSPGRRDHRRQETAGGLRFGRQGHVLSNRSTAWRRSGCWRCSGNPRASVPPVDLGILAGKGSLFVTRPTLNTYTATREDLLTAARELFDVVKSGAVKLAINQTYPLRDAAQAHRDLREPQDHRLDGVYGLAYAQSLRGAS